MTGHYKLSDDTEYEVFIDTVMEGKKKVSSLMARCTKSQTKTDQPFPVKEHEIARNVNFGTWKKI